MKRREFLTVASGAGTAGAVSATAAAASRSEPAQGGAATPNGTATNGTATNGTATGTGGKGTPKIGGPVKPDFGGYLKNVDGGYKDLRGKDEVTVMVGAQGNGGPYAFKPAGIWISPGTTVKWKWTGEGSHNVIAESGPAKLDSGKPVKSAGIHYKYTFEKGGITTYFCRPHKTLGMKGAVAVGPDVPTEKAEQGGGGSGGGGGGGGSGGLTLKKLEQMGVPFQAHFVGLATILMVVVSLVYTFFLLKYGTSPHASGGNN